MHTVGFIDDAIELFNDYTKRLKRKGIALICTGEPMSKESIHEWVLSNRIECLLIDFKLKPRFDYSGTELFAYINSIMPDLPCLILTNYPEDSANQKLVSNCLILERSEFDSTDLDEFSEKLKYHVDVFNNRLERHCKEYAELLKKRSGKGTNGSPSKWSADDDERTRALYGLLKAYGEIDDLPTDIMANEIGVKLNNLIEKMGSLLESVEK